MKKSDKTYQGIKFKASLKREPIRDDCLEDLIFWAQKFYDEGLSNTYNWRGRMASGGNLSYRVKRGFIISRSGKSMDRMRPEEFVKVTKLSKDKKTVFCWGSYLPSSEARLHWEIYLARPEIQVIFHEHDFTTLKAAKKLGLPITKTEEPYGTLALVNSVMEILDKHNFIVLKNHGVLVLGKNFQEVGELALEVHQKAIKKLKEEK